MIGGGPAGLYFAILMKRRDSSREVVVSRGGVELARTNRAQALFETGLPTRWYVPRFDVRMDLLIPSATVTHCP